MLRNTGSYGPNDAPLNMGASLNMTPMSGQNKAHNLSNLSKISQQTSQPPSEHYSLPDYSNYNQPPLNIGGQISPFQNYQPIPYQPSFMTQSVVSQQDTWPNGTLPDTLNVQNSSGTKAMVNILSGCGLNDIKDTVSQKKLTLKIPQVQIKRFQRDMGSYDDYTNNDIVRHKDSGMVPQESSLIDSDRRRSLEKTVKLIENILIHSTSKNKSTEIIDEIESDPLLLSPGNESLCNEDNDSNHSNDINNDNTESDDVNSDSEDVKPIGITEKLVLEDTTTGIMSKVVVKVEEASWTDVEYVQPYDKDVNGIMRENVTDCEIVNSDSSINEATVIVMNGIKSNPNTYYECPNCSLVFNHPKRLLIHTKWHAMSLTNDKKAEQAKERELKRNQKKEAKVLERLNAKEVKQDSNVKYPCKDCEKIFNVKSSLKNHRQKFHPTRVRECKICSKQVFGWMALRAHVAAHSGETGGFQCKDCPKQFKYKQSLAKHRDTHLEKTHECAECKKMFGSQALLKMHMKTHERAQRGATYRCTYCAKGFFESYNLQVHERTHRNERPFCCEICNTSFGTNSSLKRHLKVSHSTSKPHSCPICHRSFVTESIRDRHQLRAHGDPEDFKFICEQCPCRYLKVKDLQKHIYKVHPTGKRRKKVKSESE